MKWRDTTSYSRSQRLEDRVPTEFQAELGAGVRLCVFGRTGAWSACTYQMNVQNTLLFAITAEEAQAEAVRVLRARLAALLAALPEVP